MKTIPWAWVTSGHHLDIGVFTSPGMSPGQVILTSPLVARAGKFRETRLYRVAPISTNLIRPGPLPHTLRVFYDAFGWVRGRFAAKHGGPRPPRAAQWPSSRRRSSACRARTDSANERGDANKRSCFRAVSPRLIVYPFLLNHATLHTIIRQSKITL